MFKILHLVNTDDQSLVITWICNILCHSLSNCLAVFYLNKSISVEKKPVYRVILLLKFIVHYISRTMARAIFSLLLFTTVLIYNFVESRKCHDLSYFFFLCDCIASFLRFLLFFFVTQKILNFFSLFFSRIQSMLS